MISTLDVAWLAGLIEGDGCPYLGNHSIHLYVKMTDEDVVLRAAALLGGKVWAVSPRREGSLGKKPAWKTVVSGGRAAAWMMTLYPLLGQRRREKVRAALSYWLAKPVCNARKTHCPHGHPYNPENTYEIFRARNGGRKTRVCRTCHLAGARRPDSYRAKPRPPRSHPRLTAPPGRA